jgi:phosphoribosylformimino-5-aminoimidazole carboxamide ribotide isomerase
VEVIPAIDIKGGRCVRLYQGDYDRETVYSDAPVGVAMCWVGEGAARIHVVDLDGAKAGAPVNAGVVEEIAAKAGVPVQLGGGISDLAAARAAVERGIDRVILGTAAVEEPAIVEQLCAELGGEAVVVSVDAWEGQVMLQGWTRASGVAASEVLKQVESLGVRRFVYTDIVRDATLTEPNFRAIEDLMRMTRLKMIVAGGVSSVDHLVRLSETEVEAAIVGKAIYTGDVDLREAIEALAEIPRKDS